jgi:hypothetical protein
MDMVGTGYRCFADGLTIPGTQGAGGLDAGGRKRIRELDVEAHLTVGGHGRGFRVMDVEAERGSRGASDCEYCIVDADGIDGGFAGLRRTEVVAGFGRFGEDDVEAAEAQVDVLHSSDELKVGGGDFEVQDFE